MKEKIKERKIKIAILLIMMIVAMIIVILITNASTTVSRLTANYESSETELTETLTWDISNSDDDSVTAVLTTDGTLTISGTGEMTDWSSGAYVSWYDYNDEITTVVIQEGVTNIGNNAFYDCSNLTEVTIAEGVTDIGDGAFKIFGSELTSIELPTTLESIGENTFNYCYGLTSIEIPGNVSTIGTEVFYSCDSLISITVDDDNENYSSEDGILFNKDKTSLVRYPEGITDTSYTIPDTVTSVEDGAFRDCSYLTSVEIQSGVTNIGENAFRNSALTNIEIPDSVASIDNCAFNGCSDLTSMVLPNNLETIESGLIGNCSSLVDIEFPENLATIESYAFMFCDSLVYVELPNTVESIGFYAFAGCSSLKTINFPEGLTTIGSEAFLECNNLEITSFPSTLTSIGSTFAFYGCKYIYIVEIEDDTEETITIDTPDIILRTLDEDDIMYADGSEPTLTNCSLSDDYSTMTFSLDDFENDEVSYYITGGSLWGLTVLLTEEDTTPPTVTVSYSTTETTTGSVIVTITADEELMEIDGWTLSEDGLTLTKEYTENTTETITVYDEAGNGTLVTIEITNISTEESTYYTITLNLNGGEMTIDEVTYNDDNPYEESVLDGYTYENTNTPTKDGYTFAGWEDDDGNITETIYVEEISSDMTFTATWTEDSDSDDTNSTDDSSSNSTTTNSTDDSSSNSATSNSSSSTNSSNSSSNSNSSNSSSSSSSNSSTSTNSSSSSSSLPYTGTKVILIGIIAVFGTIAVVVRRKWNDLNGI